MNIIFHLSQKCLLEKKSFFQWHTPCVTQTFNAYLLLCTVVQYCFYGVAKEARVCDENLYVANI
jgi:hypothetical protein